MARWSALPAAFPLLMAAAANAGTFVADPAATSGPDYYVTLLAQLKPGDTLVLPAGTYRERLALSGLNGTAGGWITITGPETGPPAVITTDSNCCNDVQLGDTSYVAIKNLTIDSNSVAVDASIDGVNAKGGFTHDILIENNVITGVTYHQATVGIATHSTSWNWTIRGNTIVEAGTGMYLGNPDGSAPFINAVIEGNLFVDSIGYDTEIKYQNPYTLPAGLSPEPHKTIIRHNVWLKRRAQSSWPSDKIAGARPNLLVSGFPASGDGSQDMYEIYGNFFYDNRDGEALLQAAGRVAVHDNVFAGGTGAAIVFQNHDLPVMLAHVYNNTIYALPYGIRFSSAAQTESRVVGNLVFADMPILGPIGTTADNIVGPTSAAGNYVKSPSLVLGSMDFYPLPGATDGPALDLSAFSAETDYDRDFNGDTKGDRTSRGAYAGEGTNPGWALDAARKDIGQGLPPTGQVRPDPPTKLAAD